MGRIKYLKGLDGIRALAISLILIYHYWPTGNGPVKGGFIGVDIFFVVSGFIITYLLWQEWQQIGKIDVWHFWIRRIRRLFPALIFLVVTVALLATFVPKLASIGEEKDIALVNRYLPDLTDEQSALKYHTAFALTYSLNWYYVFQNRSYFELTDRPPLLEHLWSLAIEKQFYLLWPLLLIMLIFLFAGRKRPIVLTGMVLAAFSLVVLWIKGVAAPNDTRAYFGTDTRMYALLFGSILALLFNQVENWSKQNRRVNRIFDVMGIISLALVLYASLAFGGGELRIFRGGLPAVALATVFLIIASQVPTSGLVKKIFAASCFSWLGQRSYGLYLWHWPIFILTEPDYNYVVAGLELFIIRIGLLVLVVEASYQLVEKPFRNGVIAMCWKQIKLASGYPRVKLAARFGFMTAMISGIIIYSLSLTLMAQTQTPPVTVATSQMNLADFGKQTAIGAGNESILDFLELADQSPVVSIIISSEESTLVSPKAMASVVALGDSVMLGAKKYLEEFIGNVQVDAVVSRQFTEVYKIVKKMQKNNELPPLVFIHTGTNGTINKKAFREMMDDLAQCQRVVVFNLRVPRAWQEANNQLLAEIVPQYKNAILVDWQKESSARKDFFYKDGIHLKNPKGTSFYAQLAKAALNY